MDNDQTYHVEANSLVMFENELACLTKELGFFLPKLEGNLVGINIPGEQQWSIKTIIVCEVKHGNVDVITYQNLYPSWEIGVVMAMKFALARLCNEYHHQLPEDSVFLDFGRRDEEGETTNANKEEKTILRKHVEDLEDYAVEVERHLRGKTQALEEERAAKYHQAQENIALKVQIEKFKDSDTRLTMELCDKDSLILKLKDELKATQPSPPPKPQPIAKSEDSEEEEDPEEVTMEDLDDEEDTDDEDYDEHEGHRKKTGAKSSSATKRPKK